MEVAQFQPVDMISNLPDNVLDNILMRLKTREAAKTSVLSKQWRYKWVKLPQLIFNERLRHGPSQSKKLATMKFLMILYHVLLVHQGPITKFSLTIADLDSFSEIDCLIDYLPEKCVEEFTLSIDVNDDNDSYELPPSFFRCSKLRHLNLSFCVIEPPPPYFNGFNQLTRLELEEIVTYIGLLDRLISSCPLLEKLVLVSDDLDCLINIDAPMLKLISLKSNAEVCFKNCSLLAIVAVLFCEVQTRLPINLVHLKILKLSNLCLDSLDEFSSVLCLIRSSPNLKKIRISIIGVDFADAGPVLDFLEVKDYSDEYLNRLQEAKVKSITGTVAEMALIKLLLQKSSKLKRMVVWMSTRQVVDGGLGVSTEMNRFHLASPNVEGMLCWQDFMFQTISTNHFLSYVLFCWNDQINSQGYQAKLCKRIQGLKEETLSMQECVNGVMVLLVLLCALIWSLGLNSLVRHALRCLAAASSLGPAPSQHET